MNRKFALSIIAIVTLASAVGVNAAGKGRNVSNNQMPSFVEMDSDQDGRISATEFEAFRAERITQRTEEGRTLRNISNAPMFDNLDSNGDQFIDQAEFRAMPCDNRALKGRGKGMGMGRT
jgi:hypothetical protein